MKRSTVLMFCCCFLMLFGVQLAQGQTLNGSDLNPPLNRDGQLDGQLLVPSCYEFNDQIHTGTSLNNIGLSEVQQVAQSFIAGSKGRLVKVDIDLGIAYCALSSTFEFEVQLLEGDGWNGTLLASEPILVYLPLNRTMFEVQFSSPATVFTGLPYTLKIVPGTGQNCYDTKGTPVPVYAEWYGSTTNTYSDGHPYVNGVPEENVDLYFITTINPNTAVSFDVTACESYYWAPTGLTYHTSGTHVVNYTNTTGCDSIVTLNLTINSANAGADYIDDYSLTAVNNDAQYQWLNCEDNFSPIGGATEQTFFPGINGIFAVEVNDNGCVDTSECLTISAYGIAENDFGDALQYYPNPTTGQVTVDIGMAMEGLNVEVLNSLGQVISDQKIRTSGTFSIETAQAPGLYIICIRSDDGKLARFSVLKE